MCKYKCIFVYYPNDTDVRPENVHIHSSTGNDPYSVLCIYICTYAHI